MTNELKQEFTLRITRANKSETIVILCDMFLAYIEDAKAAMEQNRDEKAFREALRKSLSCLRELIASLHMEYEIAGNIYQLYRYAEREVIAAQIKRSVEPLQNAVMVMEGLNKAFREVSKQDSSPAIMTNTETVYAGMTYGKNDISENSNLTSNRGFLV